MIVAAYAWSVFVVERLFRIVKPKLLTLRWFAGLQFIALRKKIIHWFRLNSSRSNGHFFRPQRPSRLSALAVSA
jgi:hypothetical protein